MNIFKKKKKVKDFILGYYKDLNTDNYIPYFLEAESLYKELIKSDNDLDYYYNMIQKKEGCHA